MAQTKTELINLYEGFGNEQRTVRGEYHRSSAFRRSKNGITTSGYMTSLMKYYDLTDIGNDTQRGIAYGRGFAVSNQSVGDFLYSASSSGCFLQSPQGAGTPEYVHRSFQNGAYFRNVIIDPKGRLLYHQDRYLGMFDGTTATTNYVTGTVSVTNGSATVTGSGTTFTSGMVGKSFRIQGDNKIYLVSAYTSATQITLSSNYTGTTGSGKSYVINTMWNDTWKDFGATVSLPNGSTPNCPMDIYEDTVIFGRGNVITTLNVVTDTATTDASPSLDLPDGYSIDHIVSNSNGILIAGNVRGKGFAFLWDNYSDRSIAPWIWLDESVKSVCKNGSNWIIITSRSIYLTNGYSTSIITSEFLNSSVSAFITNTPRNSIVIDNYLIFGGLGGGGVVRSVLYRMNLSTKLVEALPLSSLNQGTATFAGFEFNTDPNRLFIGLNGVINGNGVYFAIFEGAPECSTYISSEVGQGDNQKIATRLKVKVRPNIKSTSNHPSSFSFKISAKIADAKQTLYRRSQVKQDGSVGSEDVITVNNGSGSFFTPKVGYEIEFIGDSNSDNNAGYSRNVTGVTGAGTATEVITVDSDFPDISKQNQTIIITPFQLISRKTINTSTTYGEIEEMIFEIKDKIKSHKFLIKIDIEDNTSGVPLEIFQMAFVYDDLGVL